ncbi:hypothetical protein HK096_003308, partial [Nowakowskiella sp. JEL0078]
LDFNGLALGEKMKGTISVGIMADLTIMNVFTEAKMTPLITVIGNHVWVSWFLEEENILLMWFPEEAIKNYQPAQKTDLENDRFRYLMMSYLDTTILEKNKVLKKIRKEIDSEALKKKNDSDSEDESDQENLHRNSKLISRFKRTLLNPVVSSWFLGFVALIFLLLPLVIDILVKTDSLAFLKVESAITNSNTTVILGIYSPIIIQNGVSKYLPRISEDLENSNYMIFPPNSIVFDNSTSFENQYVKIAYGNGSRPLLSLLFLILTTFFVILSIFIRLAAVSFEIQSILDIADILVPLFSIIAAIMAILDFSFLMAWFGTYESLMNSKQVFVSAKFGPGIYCTSFGLLLVVGLSGIAIFEGFKLKRMKEKKIETLRRRPHNNIWMPPIMPSSQFARVNIPTALNDIQQNSNETIGTFSSNPHLSVPEIYNDSMLQESAGMLRI